MTKFSITKLEEARSNPIAFAKTLSNKEQAKSNFRYAKSQRWLNAVGAYHASGKIVDAYTSLEEGLSNRKDTAANRREMGKLLAALADYEKEITKRSLILIRSRESIDLQLTKKLRIGGQIPLIFMKAAQGYSAYFVSKANANWQRELKYPILQNYMGSKIFNTDPQQIEIGYIDYLTGEFHEECFTPRELKEAESELKKMGAKISNLL